MSELARFHALPREMAVRALLECCHSRRWAEKMGSLRPFASEAALLTIAEQEWLALGEADWLEAFQAHPKIGDIESLAKKFGATRATSASEQKGVEGSSRATLEELARLNDAYEKKHGFIFIVCATGKSAEEMLALLRDRLPNSRALELRNAAEEQAKITKIRLEKLL